MERWALQLVHYCGKRRQQKSILQSQLYMESQCSKCIKSIKGDFYIGSPLPGSLHPILVSTDPEIGPKMVPKVQNLASPFLHQDIVRSGQKNIVDQLSRWSQNLPGFLIPSVGDGVSEVESRLCPQEPAPIPQMNCR